MNDKKVVEEPDFVSTSCELFPEGPQTIPDDLQPYAFAFQMRGVDTPEGFLLQESSVRDPATGSPFALVAMVPLDPPKPATTTGRVMRWTILKPEEKQEIMRAVMEVSVRDSVSFLDKWKWAVLKQTRVVLIKK